MCIEYDASCRTKQIGKVPLAMQKEGATNSGKAKYSNEHWAKLIFVGDIILSKRQKRESVQSKECNLAMVLICTVATFFLCHTPRYFHPKITLSVKITLLLKALHFSVWGCHFQQTVCLCFQGIGFSSSLVSLQHCFHELHAGNSLKCTHNTCFHLFA